MNGPEVAVLYGDLTVTRVPWVDKLTLDRTQVIAIAVLDPHRANPRKRPQAVIEHDWYTLVWDDTACHLGGYDDNLYWHDFTDAATGWRHRFPYLMPSGSMVFEGVMLTPTLYAEAKGIYGDREGVMF